MLRYISIRVKIRLSTIGSLHCLYDRLKLAITFIAWCLLTTVIRGNNLLAFVIPVSFHQANILLDNLVWILLQILVCVVP